MWNLIRFTLEFVLGGLKYLAQTYVPMYILIYTSKVKLSGPIVTIHIYGIPLLRGREVIFYEVVSRKK